LLALAGFLTPRLTGILVYYCGKTTPLCIVSLFVAISSSINSTAIQGLTVIGNTTMRNIFEVMSVECNFIGIFATGNYEQSESLNYINALLLATPH
jgi:hypothetical protein